ncbi:UPF0547 protein C16orf87 homolog isoform X1 [Daphnia carinata]|uniref:UPF0547 protein C16orf87 homolog isoform X1 n=1 Tax=Daphnia carinata TaxID=120202 RepID=UPI002580CD22|nr:UPF0547 protein C16orf87 homolog isoform X1 [Daphnia carinata]
MVMAPKGNSKAITKSCPSCSKHVAVACKNCPCGHIFFVARRSSALVSKMKEEADRTTRVSPPPPPDPSTSSRFQPGIRRTERVKRDKPDFYNASEYDKQRKPKSSRQRLAASVSEDRDDLLGDESDQAAGNKRGRGRRRRKRNLAGELIDEKKIEDDEAGPVVPAHKQLCLGINLSEINRKLIAVNPIF